MNFFLIKLPVLWGFHILEGPHIDALATEGNPDAIEFPKALSESGEILNLALVA